MDTKTTDSFDAVHPQKLSLDLLIGEWDVSETHTLLLPANGSEYTLICRWASGFGKAFCDWVFD